MRSISLLSRPMRRHLQERLERLHEALIGLGQRLREGIAALVGGHVGDAVRDAVHALLEHRPADAGPARPALDESFPGRFTGHEDPPGDDQEPSGLWAEVPPQPLLPSPPPASPPAAPEPPRWRSLLATGLEALVWWLHYRPARRVGLAALAVGAAAGAVALAAGPVVGALAATVAAALALTHLASGVTDAAGSLASTRGS